MLAQLGFPAQMILYTLLSSVFFTEFSMSNLVGKMILLIPIICLGVVVSLPISILLGLPIGLTLQSLNKLSFVSSLLVAFLILAAICAFLDSFNVESILQLLPSAIIGACIYWLCIQKQLVN